MSLNLELSHWSYVAMLLFTMTGSWWLEFAFRIRVLRRPKILFASVLPVALFFLAWDAFAINQNHWNFDPNQMLGIIGPLNIPLEEYLFFLVIPIAAVLTLEGVKVVLRRFSK
jgi:lycopene cyclase domain-containing protein